MSILKLIINDLKQPKKQDPAFVNSTVEIIFNYPGVWALVNHRFANWFYQKKFKIIARIISGITRYITNVDIHPGASIGKNVFFDHAFGIVIGQTAVIGNNVLIYQGVTLGGVSLSRKKRHPTIEDNVVIGAGAKVLGNITIGKNSKIGANSVVVKDVPADSTAAGIPAKVIIKSNNKPLSHDDIPDVNNKLCEYVLQRLLNLENMVSTQNTNIQEHKENLEEKYQEYLKSIQTTLKE